ncbi:MAG: CPBP family intramembrane metalloprotease [Acidobacteria bacterium]|nr:CPBP family intramembrane metalloprotease [Acidobacteriota bacterium]
MNSFNFFINPQTKLLRCGWRALAFLFVLSLPQWMMATLFKSSAAESGGSVFDVSLATILVYLILVAWVLLLSWVSLKFLDGLSFRSLGVSFHSHWRREITHGFAIAFMMIVAVFAVQTIGGSRVEANPFWFNGGINPSALSVVCQNLAMALILMILAGAFEELVFRGYPFQTLLRGLPPVVPILILSVYFGLGHWGNPSRTLFSTVNTVLAGIWLALAYLKTRSLWFPIALHVGWNWTMGAIFGFPVSGLLIPKHPLLLSTEGTELWLTGGSYGPEGGAAATIVVLITSIWIWKSDWLTVAPEMQAALSEPAPQPEAPVRLNLQNEES